MLQADTLSAIELPFPLPIVLLISLLQNVVLLGGLILIGLLLSKKVGLGLPVIEAWLEKRPLPKRIGKNITLAIGLGAISAVVIILLDGVFISLGVNLGGGGVTIPVWQGFLASFYGAIGEEMQLRLFFMTLLVWLASKVVRTNSNTPSSSVMWFSIVVAAVLFGLGHLPATAQLTPLTPLVIARGIVLNGIAGMAFGWLYWKKGLEFSMVAHFSSDIILHVVLPIFMVL